MAKRNIFYDRFAKTKRRLFKLALVATFLLFGSGFGVLKLSNMEMITTGLETIYEDRVMPLQQLKIISDGYAISILGTAHRILNGNLSWAKGKNIVNQASTLIPVTWDEYMKTNLVDEEKKLIADLTPLLVGADSTTKKLIEVLQAEDSTALAELTQKSLHQEIDPVVEKISALFQLQIGIAKVVHDRERLRSQYSRSLGMATIVIGAVLSLIIASTWRSMNRSIKNIMD